MRYSDDDRPVSPDSHGTDYPNHTLPLTARSLLDSFTSNICIIDEAGTIIQTNEAWDSFARANGASPESMGKGINYLNVVRHSNPEVYTILTNILSGKSKGHTYEYECNSPTEKRWFVLSVSPLAEENFTGALLQHFNITHRRKMELELEKSEHKYRFFFEKIPFAVIKTDENFRILRWNKAAEEIFGYTPNEMIGAEMFKLYYSDADNPANTRDRIVSTLKKGEVNFSENYNRKKDGTKILCSWKDVPYITPEGETLYFSIAEDISLRKKMETELKESELKYRTFARHFPDIILIFDRDLRYHLVDGAGLANLKLRREEIIGKTIYDILPEETCNIMEPNYRDALRGKKRSFRVTFQSRDFLVRVVPLIDAGGNTKRGMAIAQDITHQLEMEQILAVAEEKYKTLINTTGTGYFISDLEGNLLDVNDEFLEQASHTLRKKVIGTNIMNYIADYDKDLFTREIGKCRDRSSIRNLQIDFTNDQNKIRNIIMNASVIREKGFYRIMAVTTDITTYKLLEARLKMESLGTLVLGIGHDFNNILAKITGHASLILETNDLREEALNSLKLISAAADKGADLVTKLYEFGMPKKMSTVSVDLYSCIRDVFDLFEMTSNRLIEKRIEFGKGEFFVQGEYHDMFFNLTKNAIDAIEERKAKKGDYITVRAREHTPMEATNVDPERPYILVEFVDSGQGIPSSYIDRIFEPGFSTKPLGTDSGRGFGLAMAYKAVDGRISVITAPGKGTRFVLYLIKAESAHIEKQGPDKPIDVRGNETILVVDDEEAILEFSKEALGRKGYDVITAENGEDAVTILELNSSLIDLVIFDLTMPKMSGGEAFQKMKAHKEDGKFIVSSGHHENYLKAKNLQRVDAFLQKPYKADLLLKTVREVLNK